MHVQSLHAIALTVGFSDPQNRCRFHEIRGYTGFTVCGAGHPGCNIFAAKMWGLGRLLTSKQEAHLVAQCKMRYRNNGGIDLALPRATVGHIKQGY